MPIGMSPMVSWSPATNLRVASTLSTIVHSSLNRLVAAAIAAMSRCSGLVSMRPRKIVQPGAESVVSCQSIQRSASARIRRSVGHNVPAPNLAAM